MKKRNLLIFVLISLYLVNTATKLILLSSVFTLNVPQNIAILRKVSDLQDTINTYYYEDTDNNIFIEGIYRGIVDSLNDPYSQYFTKEEYEDYMIGTTGKYAGIGAALTQDETTGVVTVSRVYEGSPAEGAGISDGDTIVSADGFLATDEELNEFVQRIRGEEDTQVNIVYIHNEKEISVDITRKQIITPSVTYNMLDDDTGFLAIMEFQEDTANEFAAAIKDLESSGMTNIIYDLRSNPGGLVSSVTDILDQILPEGVTVYMEDKNGKRTDYTSDESSQLNYPCVVLVNKYTASSSEIFAGAIRDFNRGTILGTVTTGKGVVQNIIRLSDGSAIKLTVANYFTPNGTNIHKVGIVPDIELEQDYTGPEDEPYDWHFDNQVQKALEILDDK